MKCKEFCSSILIPGHKKRIVPLLADLAGLDRFDIEVLLTLNAPEEIDVDCDDLPFFVTLMKSAAQ